MLSGADIPLTLTRVYPAGAIKLGMHALNDAPIGKSLALPRHFRGRTMNRTLTMLALGVSLFAGAVSAQAAPELELARIDCGTPQAPTAVNERFYRDITSVNAPRLLMRSGVDVGAAARTLQIDLQLGSLNQLCHSVTV